MPDLFKDWLPSITFSKEDITEGVDEYAVMKDYSPFMINRALSQYPDCVFDAMEMNRRPWLDKKLQYDYLRFSLAKKKRFSKWAKGVSNPKINTIIEVYKISVQKAEEIADLISDDELKLLEEYLFKGGKNG